jgi:hypothetical protein
LAQAPNQNHAQRSTGRCVNLGEVGHPICGSGSPPVGRQRCADTSEQHVREVVPHVVVVVSGTGAQGGHAPPPARR